MDKDLISIQEARECVRRAKAAGEALARMEQGELDKLVAAVARGGKDRLTGPLVKAVLSGGNRQQGAAHVPPGVAGQLQGPAVGPGGGRGNRVRHPGA